MPLKRHLFCLPFLLLILIVGLTATSSYAQEANNNYFIIGTVKDTETGKKMEGVTITVKQNGTKFDEIVTSNSGKYEFYLPLGENYDITFSKDDYVSKTVRLETSDIPEEDRAGGFRTDLDMTLFVKPKGFDESITSKPIGIARFNEQQNAIAFDFAYTEKVQNEINKELERIEKLAEKREEMQDEFDQLVAKGDKEMQSEEYGKGIAFYEEALDIFPDDEPVQQKLADARAKLEARKAAEELEANYNKLIELGEDNLQAGKLNEAKSNFEEALKLKPNESMPKAKIDEIDKLLDIEEKNKQFESLITEADKKFNSKDYSAAIEKYQEALEVKPGESYPTNKIAEAQKRLDDMEQAEELQAQYDKLINDANELFNSKSYEESIEKYQEASTLMPKETYPKNRISEAENKIAERDARLASQEEAAEAAALNEQYQNLISEGETLFANESFEQAKAKFSKASELKPSESYPQQKIQQIDEAIENKKSEMLAEEREAEEAAQRAKIDKEYQQLIDQANSKFDQEELEAARSDYQAALELKPNERYPQTRITRIDELITQRAQSEEADAIAEQQKAAEQARREEEEKARREREAQARLAEEQRLEALEAEKRERERLAEERRKQEEEDRAKERELLSNVDTSQEDDVEKFYRTARKSDLQRMDDKIEGKKTSHQEYLASLSEEANESRQEKLQEINNKEDKREEIHRKGESVLEEKRESNQDLQEMHDANLSTYSDSSDRRRSYNLGETQRMADNYAAVAYNDEVRQERAAEVQEKKEAYQENQQSFVKKGDVLRTDQEYEVQRQREKLENMKTEGEEIRQENIAETQSQEQAYSELQSDYSRAAYERRMTNYEKVEEKRMEQEKIGQDNQGMPSNDYEEIARIKERQENFYRTKQKESELKRDLNYSEQHKKKNAEPPSYEDYTLPEGGEELAEGVTETSYDIMGGRTVIERTVRIGNKVDVYKKVISKTSTYYFKNDRSITETTWKQNTLQ